MTTALVKFDFKLGGKSHTAYVYTEDPESGWHSKDKEVERFLNETFPVNGYVTNGEPPGFTAAKVAHEELGGDVGFAKNTWDDIGTE